MYGTVGVSIHVGKTFKPHMTIGSSEQGQKSATTSLPTATTFSVDCMYGRVRGQPLAALIRCTQGP